MLRRNFMPRANNTALEKREGRFHSVCMHVAVRVFARVIDGLMKVLLHLVERVRVDLRFIRHNDFDVTAYVCVNDVADGLGLRIASADQAQISIALTNADNHSLVALRTPSASLAAYVGFIYLNGATELFRRYFQHGSANPVTEVPRRFIADSKRALNLAGRHALLGFAEQTACESRTQDTVGLPASEGVLDMCGTYFHPQNLLSVQRGSFLRRS